MTSMCKPSFWYSLGAGAWIALVATFTQNANSWFGTQDTIISVIAVLLLFSISALVVGGLIVGKPIFLYIDGKKKEAIQMLLCSGGWLLLFFLIVLAILAVR